jgi:alkaline phosphatase D
MIDFIKAENGDILVESQFLRDTDGWFVTVEGGQTKLLTALPVEFDRVSRKIKSGDQGDLAWYFSAPQKFLGDQSSFYHGTLEFNLV